MTSNLFRSLSPSLNPLWHLSIPSQNSAGGSHKAPFGAEHKKKSLQQDWRTGLPGTSCSREFWKTKVLPTSVCVKRQDAGEPDTVLWRQPNSSSYRELKEFRSLRFKCVPAFRGVWSYGLAPLLCKLILVRHCCFFPWSGRTLPEKTIESSDVVLWELGVVWDAQEPAHFLWWQ